MDNILITAISGDVANSILKCLINYYGKEHLVGCDIYEYPVGLNKVSHFYRVSPCREKSLYISQLLEICKKESIKLLIPTNESEISCLNSNRDIFRENKIELMLHSREIYDVFFNKYYTQCKLKDLNLPFIHSFLGSTYNNELPYPVVVKDVFSSGSKKVNIIKNSEEFNKLGNLTDKQVVQAYIGVPDQEYTVPIFSTNEGKSVFCIPLRRTLSKAGYTNFIEPVDTIKYNIIYKICTSIASAFKLNGCLDLQMRFFNDNFYIFECNPRLSGTVHFRHKLGFSDAFWWSELLLGHDVSPKFAYPTKFVGVRELNEEIFWI